MEDDPVRMELEKAIEKKIPVVTVLLDGVKQPGKADLPPSLSQLATTHPFELTTEFEAFREGISKLAKFLQKFPNRRPNESLQKAELCIKNGAPDWFQDTSTINVFANNKKIGEILANKATYRFPLEQGTYEVQFRRGLLYRSNKVTVNLRPGTSATISYTWKTIGGIKLETIEG